MTRPSQTQLIERATQLILEERRAGIQHWFYISYADDQRGFLGGIYTQAYGFVEAVTRIGVFGLSPGGEAHGVECAEEDLPPNEWRERLLSKEQLEAATGQKFKSIKQWMREQNSDA